jgi:hypothetical protein
VLDTMAAPPTYSHASWRNGKQDCIQLVPPDAGRAGVVARLAGAWECGRLLNVIAVAFSPAESCGRKAETATTEEECRAPAWKKALCTLEDRGHAHGGSPIRARGGHRCPLVIAR